MGLLVMLIFALIIAGVVCWLIALLPDPPVNGMVKQVGQIIVVLFLLLYLLGSVGHRVL